MMHTDEGGRKGERRGGRWGGGGREVGWGGRCVRENSLQWTVRRHWRNLPLPLPPRRGGGQTCLLVAWCGVEAAGQAEQHLVPPVQSTSWNGALLCVCVRVCECVSVWMSMCVENKFLSFICASSKLSQSWLKLQQTLRSTRNFQTKSSLTN